MLFNASPTVSPRTAAQPPTAGVRITQRHRSRSDAEVFGHVGSHPRNGRDRRRRQLHLPPDAAYAATGTTDSFGLGVSDDVGGFHLHGLVGLLSLFTFGLVGGKAHEAEATITVNVAPFRPPNSAPTGVVALGTPDVGGVVTGVVSGADIDGDPLTYSGTTTTVKGSVTVATDGSFTHPDVDCAPCVVGVISDHG